MIKIVLRFAKGGVLEGELREEFGAPQTIAILSQMGKISSLARNSRYSGREVYFPIPSSVLAPKEQYSIYVSKGDIIYWRAWRDDGHDPVMSFYYGPELARSSQGDEPVNIIGHIREDLLPLAQEIGERVWLQGAEQVEVEIIKE